MSESTKSQHLHAQLHRSFIVLNCSLLLASVNSHEHNMLVLQVSPKAFDHGYIFGSGDPSKNLSHPQTKMKT